MSNIHEFPKFSADEAIALYEESISYYTPADFIEPETDVEATGPVVEYYDAA